MYFPILRGRQFELLALRECVEKKILSNHIIPIVEPVKVSSTFIKTVDSFINADKSLAIILNPLVGSWDNDIVKDSNIKIREGFNSRLEDKNIIISYYVDRELEKYVLNSEKKGVFAESMILICNNPEYVNCYEEVIKGKTPMYNLIPDKSDFRRRIRKNRVICEDHFPKQARNIDYLKLESEFFSSDHLYYDDDGYVGFGDYSIVGEEYSETGFAPYAVAIHIVYFDNNSNLRVAHFVSDTNDDISDPARKFSEAVEKLVEWNKEFRLDTLGIHELEEAYRNETYPGLGVIKKYSIMHHLELMSRYLDGVIE